VKLNTASSIGVKNEMTFTSTPPTLLRGVR